MEIRTKHNIGDVVFFLEENKVQSAAIDHIAVQFSADKEIQVHINNRVLLKYKKEKDPSAGFTSEERYIEKYLYFKDEEVFPTKEDLLKSL